MTTLTAAPAASRTTPPPGLSAGPRPEPPGAWAASAAFGWRALLKIKHVPEMLLDVIVIPVVFTLLFTYLFGGALTGSPHRYLQFILPSTLVMAVLLVTMYAETGLATDRAKGITDRFCVLPITSADPGQQRLRCSAHHARLAAGPRLGQPGQPPGPCRARADGRPPGRRANGLGAARLGGARRGVRPGHRLALWQAAVSAVGTGQTGYCTASQDTPQGPASVRHLARHQVMGLASVFLLGMAVNLIGLPAETSGAAHLASIAFLAAHALIGLGLVIGTVPLLRAAARLGGLWRRRAITGAAAIAVGVVADILTLIPRTTGGPTPWRWASSRRCSPPAACSCQQAQPRKTVCPLPRPRAAATSRDKQTLNTSHRGR
jgi:hypothetical protein